MSFVKKLITPKFVDCKTTNRVNLGNLVPIPPDEPNKIASVENENENSDEKPKPKPDSMATESMDVELDDLNDVVSMEANFRLKRTYLNQKFDKARRLQRKMNSLRSNITQLCHETEQITRVIDNSENQPPVLQKDFVVRRDQLVEKINAVPTTTKDSDMKKREPIMYKKYGAIKSSQEVGHYLNLLQTKQKTLMHLELLAMQKVSSFKLGQKPLTTEKGPAKPAVPKKPPRDSLQSMYQDLLKSFAQVNPVHPPSPSDSAVENSISNINQSGVDTELGLFSLVSSTPEPGDPTEVNDGSFLESEV